MRIKFVEEAHTYTAEDGRELISVSKFTDSFKEKVDWGKIANNVAKKLTKAGTPTTTRDVLEKWENKRKKSAEIGTLYHLIRENELLRQDNPTFYDTQCTTTSCVMEDKIKWSIPICELSNNTVYAELMIYDLDYLICGQADKVIVTNNTINVWDYKTDMEITFKGFSNQWTKPKKLLPPLSHLDDCNGNVYSIKMSLYMYLLWKANKGRLKPGELVIEHIILKRDPNNDNIPVLDSNGNPIEVKREYIHLPYRKKEVIEMLKTIKNERQTDLCRSNEGGEGTPIL